MPVRYTRLLNSKHLFKNTHEKSKDFLKIRIPVESTSSWIDKTNSKNLAALSLKKKNHSELAEVNDLSIRSKKLFLNNFFDSKVLKEGFKRKKWPCYPKKRTISGYVSPFESKSFFRSGSLNLRTLADLNTSKVMVSIKGYTSNKLANSCGYPSNNYLSEVLKPKSSTYSAVAGVSRDKGRSLVTKIVNQFNKKGNQRSIIKWFIKASNLFNLSLKMDKGSAKFKSLQESAPQLKYLNLSYNNAPFLFLSQVFTVLDKATPKFYIKKHISKSFRKKKKNKAPKLRSYLAFLEPRSRRAMSLKWLMQGFFKIAKNHKFYKKLFFFIINDLAGITKKTAVRKKASLYKQVLMFLKKRQ